MRWQRIDVAPPDVPLLVWDGYRMEIATWSAQAERWFIYDGQADTEPIVWMPLPEPPEKEER